MGMKNLRPKTRRAYEHTMHIYGMSFGFRKPYQIILDPLFVHASVKQDIDLETDLATTLDSDIRAMVTECTIQELRKKGNKFQEAAEKAKHIERRRCPHKDSVPSAQCISEMIDTNNPHHYCVATQDPSLRKKLRKVPGVPLLHINHNAIVLEPISSFSKQAIDQAQYEKARPPPAEREMLKRMFGGEEEQQQPRPKKRKAKGPNPLSCKKKQKQTPPPPRKKKAGSEPSAK
ncbi:hypothetical protein EC973_004743 [Apophysomyces ossiformis]|uniref:U three protein 23 n=1 Tax=Apophysomyces ossiformis TaxID=679940 RepID=A0A8H7ERS2_9FUNG|nr:hypothetical protein EC973_004743 [Apophysomyces ossiformis]